MTIAIYPGSFDPITYGHTDVATRAARLFTKLIVGIYTTPGKPLLFNLEERLDMAKRALANIPNIEVQSFSGLAVDFAKQVEAQAMVRGLRVSADFEMEFDMAMMNSRLYPELELICLMANPEYQFLSSSLMKEVAKLGGNINGLVPENVAEALAKKEGVHKM